MLLELSVAFFGMALMGLVVLHRREQRRQSPVHAALPPERQSELELLLAELQTAADRLNRTLNAEARLGAKTFEAQDDLSDVPSDPALAGWLACCKEVQNAQTEYCRATEAFHEFVGHLTPALRITAIERRARLGRLTHADPPMI